MAHLFPGKRKYVYYRPQLKLYLGKGDYNSIFALLNKLVGGDIIFIKFNDQIYKISSK
jgi:hypothetical protein